MSTEQITIATPPTNAAELFLCLTEAETRMFLVNTYDEHSEEDLEDIVELTGILSSEEVRLNAIELFESGDAEMQMIWLESIAAMVRLHAIDQLPN